MLKDPYTGLKELFKYTYEKDKEFFAFSFEHTDKLITWLIGFAVAGISLIIANIKELRITKISNFRFIVLLLSITIIFGLLYRLTSYFVLIKNKSLENYFHGFLTTLTLKVSSPQIFQIQPLRKCWI